MERNTRFKFLDLSYLPLLVSAILTILAISWIYIENQNILKERLKERLVAIASTASLQINANEVEQIRDERDLGSKELRHVVNVMNKIRSVNEDLRYIYIWRKTNDPNNLAFVADAEMLEPIDTDGNGKIEGDEIPPAPGEPYEINQIPDSSQLFIRPIAQDEFIQDKWGTFLSGSAPIRNAAGNAVAVLGIDVEVSDFLTLTKIAFVPFAVLASFLLLLLTIQTVALIRIWRSRVTVFKELDRQKDTLISIVSHQLATPITSVKWYIEMLLDGDAGKITPEQEKELKTMQSVIGNLADLVSMLLDVSRIQLGRMKVDKASLKLDAFFEEILAVIRPKTEQKKLHFVVALPKHFPEAVLDKRLVRMTLENLLSNAVKYTPEGGKITFNVSADDKMLRCEIGDSGIGIPLAEQPKLFEKLFRASNVRNVNGNGLGLFIAKGAVEAQGGSIRFTSKESKGTTFIVELPLGKNSIPSDRK